MTQLWMQKAFQPVKRHVPQWIWSPVRRLLTGLLAPVRFSWHSGHLRSSLYGRAVSRAGDPVPWYTYPSIDFLKHRSFADRLILEFGAGQSTLWWAQRARQVVAFEGDRTFFEALQAQVPANVSMHLVAPSDAEAGVAFIEGVLGEADRLYDVVIVDGLWRYALIDVAIRWMKETGCIVCDDAEGYGFGEAFQARGFQHVDFFGYAPGVVLPHCTSLFFRGGSFVFDAGHPIPNIAAAS